VAKLPFLAVAICTLVLAPTIPGATKPAPKKTARTAAERWLSTLTLRQKVAQLIVIPFSGEAPNTRSRQYRQFERLVRDQQVGGLILISRTAHGIKRAEPYALAAFLNRMQRLARIPLLVASDFERGASMRVDSTTQFPHAMAFAAAGDPQATRYLGEATARDARALGVHWVFFPVADVNSNPDNPIINIRSFGESPRDVSAHVRAFIDGAKADPKNRVLTTAKHFPGHGDTAVDSHLALSSIPSDKEHLESVEFPPFRAAIEEGVDSVMTAHISVPALDAPDLPATLSTAILTGVLRDELKFQGLIVTDALEMGGVAKGYSNAEAAVRALEAGADVLLMPPDPGAAIQAVVAAVRSGRLSSKRIDQSVARILAAKQTVGLDRAKLVNLEAIADVVNSPEAAARAQQIADRAVTLVRNDGDVIPLRNPGRACFFVLPESRDSMEGQALLPELDKRSAETQVFALDPAMLRVLRDHQGRQLLERVAMAGDWGNELDLVFTREDGSPIHPQAFSEMFEKHVKDSKLPKLSLHGLRHTHATIALRAGVHPKVVSERLGHASVAFTLDVYTDSLPDMQETAANLIAALVLDT